MGGITMSGGSSLGLPFGFTEQTRTYRAAAAQTPWGRERLHRQRMRSMGLAAFLAPTAEEKAQQQSVVDDAQDAITKKIREELEKEARNRGGSGGTPEETLCRQVVGKIKFRAEGGWPLPPQTWTSAEICKPNSDRPDPNAPSNVKRFKPTLDIESPLFGRKTFAPGGPADPNAWKSSALRAAGLAGGALLLYTLVVGYGSYRLGKRKAG